MRPPLLSRNSSSTNTAMKPVGSAQLKLSTLLVAYAAAGLAVCFTIFRAYTTSQPVYPPGSLPEGARGQGAGACRMSYMSPSYLHLSGFGREFSRMGNGPWGLYLYREAGWDEDPYVDDGHGGRKLHLTGTPVLFVPGNAGSFRQVRSLASAASRSWYEAPGVERRGARTSEGGAHLDFFTIDFNDDFSAFHGQTLLDQAEYTADCIRYILSLYAHHEDEASGRKRPDPLSVIVVGHSMGGVVARAAFLSQNYQPYSISTLVTFATPHVVPPVTVDAGVDRVYAAINSYWREAYDLANPAFVPATKAVPVTPALANFRPMPHEELRNLVLVSIAGGLSDVTIASESVSLASLVPSNGSNGFTVFTTAIPGVQTPIDHLAILWCQQLMQVVAEGLLAIVDVRRPQGVTPRSERLTELGMRWVGALELPAAARTVDHAPRRVALSDLLADASETHHVQAGDRLVYKPSGDPPARRMFSLKVPKGETRTGPRAFSLSSSSTIGAKRQDDVEVWTCGGDFDETGSPQCSRLARQHITQLPASPHSSVSPILPAPIEYGSMSYVLLDEADLLGLTDIVVIVKDGSSDWVVAEFADVAKSQYKLDHGALHLLLNGARIPAFPSSPSLVSELWLPALDTSLLALKLHVCRSTCQEHSSLFAPLVRQFSPILHESKYFPNARVASLYTHASGPFIPPASSPFAATGSRLQVFLDPTCPQDASAGEVHDLALEVHVDLRATLGNLVVRFRMALVTMPFAIVMLVVGLQVRKFNTGSPFPSFGETMSHFVRKYLPGLLAGLLALSYLQAIMFSTHAAADDHLAAAEPGHRAHAHLSSPSPWLPDFLLGTPGSFWAPLAPLLAFTSVGIVCAEYLVLWTLVACSGVIVRWLQRNGSQAQRNFFRIADVPDTLALQRVLTLAVLLLAVIFFAPYQFAFLVMVLVHLCSTVRALLVADAETAAMSASEGRSGSNAGAAKRSWDRYHYTFSILFILLLLSPINASILVVWVRNLAVGWLAPFSSDHNLFLILGFLANIEALHSGKLLQRSVGHRNVFSIPTAAAFIVPAGYALFYGIRSAHRLYSLANISFAWLAFGTTDAFLEIQDRLASKLPAIVASEPSPTLQKRRLSVPPQPDAPPETEPKAGHPRKVASLSSAFTD